MYNSVWETMTSDIQFLFKSGIIDIIWKLQSQNEEYSTFKSFEIILFLILTRNSINGVMITIVVSRAASHGFEPQLGNKKIITLVCTASPPST
jgi:hypothetical protein